MASRYLNVPKQVLGLSLIPSFSYLLRWSDDEPCLLLSFMITVSLRYVWYLSTRRHPSGVLESTWRLFHNIWNFSLQIINAVWFLKSYDHDKIVPVFIVQVYWNYLNNAFVPSFNITHHVIWSYDFLSRLIYQFLGTESTHLLAATRSGRTALSRSRLGACPSAARP